VSSSTIFGAQFHGFEPIDILTIEEHETYDSALAVHFESVTTENGPLNHDPIWIDRVDRSSGHQHGAAIFLLTKHQDGRRRENDRSKHRGHYHRFRPEESFSLLIKYKFFAIKTSIASTGPLNGIQNFNLKENGRYLVFVGCGVLTEDRTSSKAPVSAMENQPFLGRNRLIAAAVRPFEQQVDNTHALLVWQHAHQNQRIIRRQVDR
jgi:hypothetical protein